MDTSRVPGDDSVIRRAADALAARPEVRAVFLFGSRALGEEDGFSDFDFAVLADPGADEHALDGVVADVVGVRPAHVMVLTRDTPSEVSRSIANQGLVLAEREPGDAHPVVLHRDPSYSLEEARRTHVRALVDELARRLGRTDELMAPGFDAAFADWRQEDLLCRQLDEVCALTLSLARRLGRLLGWERPRHERHAVAQLGQLPGLPTGAVAGLIRLRKSRQRLWDTVGTIPRPLVWADLRDDLKAARSLLETLRDLEILRSGEA